MIQKNEERFDLVILSSSEAAKAKLLLEESSIDDMFLIMPDASSLTNQAVSQEFKDKIAESLWHVNFMEGNTSYLYQHSRLTQQIMQNDNELRKMYLSLKIMADRKQMPDFDDPIFNKAATV